MKCSFCDKPAVYYNKISGLAYCKAHFIEYFEKRVKKTIRKYNMIREDDRVLVAVSGGKDSMSLLHIMLKLKKKMPKLEVTAMLIDEGIRGYREKTVPNLVKYAERHAAKYVIASFKDYIGETLDEIVKSSFEKGLPYMPCSYCGVFRRYIMNVVARELGATVIATAHNMDDVVQTFLMNLMSNSWERIFSLTPVRQADSEIVVKRVRPFYEVPEKETAIYALLNDLVQPEFVQCPYVKYNVRYTVRKIINELEDKYPGTKYGLLRSLLRLTSLVKIEAPRKFNACLICGNPTSRLICKACTYRAILGLLDEHSTSRVIEAAKFDVSLARELREAGVHLNTSH